MVIAPALETPNTGTWLIFGVVFLPVYGLLLGWVLGSPRDGRSLTTGIVYLVGLTVMLWIGLTALTLLIGVVFF